MLVLPNPQEGFVQFLEDYESIAASLPSELSDIDGTTSRAVLRVISSGTKTGKSLNFYLQIGNDVYRYQVLQANTTREKITLHCERGNSKLPKDKRCPHRVEVVILNSALIESKQSRKRGRNGNYNLVWRHLLRKDIPEARDIKNYEIQETFPSEACHACIPPFALSPFQDRFREGAVRRSYVKRKVDYDTEKQCLPPQWPPQITAGIHGAPSYEKKKISARLARRWTSPQTEVSEISKTIPVLQYDPNVTKLHPLSSSVVDVQFLLSKIYVKGKPIWFWGLRSELCQLDDNNELNIRELFRSPCFIDGTFNACSKIPGIAQQYSLVRYYSSEDGKKGLSYPILFIWLPDRQKETYRAAFAEIRRLYFEEVGSELIINDWRVDFEGNPKKVIKEFWPDAHVSGCQFHFSKALQENWKLKLGQKKLMYDDELRAEFLDIYAGMAFADPIIVDEALDILEKQLIPALENTKKKKIEHFHNYFKKQWIKKRESAADWNQHAILRQGSIFWTTNQSEALHLALKKSYRTPPASIRAFSEMLREYKCFYLGKFTNDFHAYRKLESLQKAENIFRLHREIERQSFEWKKDNAINICSQFSNHTATLLDFPSDYITTDAIYTVL